MGSVRQDLRTMYLLRRLEGMDKSERRAHLIGHMAARGWYTKAATCDRTFIRPETLRRWAAQNQVRRTRIMGVWFFFLASVARRLVQFHPDQAMALGIQGLCRVCGKATPTGKSCNLCEKIVFPSIGETLGGDDDDEQDA